MQKRPRQKLPIGAENLLSVFEGVEGGFAIFTGIVVGLSFQSIDRELLILSAVIGMVVNAFNASAVRYTSEHYIDELDGHEKRKRIHFYLVPAIVEFIAYVAVSCIVILPLLFISSFSLALALNIALTLLVLFAAGVYRGRLLRAKPLRDGAEVALSGALIILVGGLAGLLASRLVA